MFIKNSELLEEIKKFEGTEFISKKLHILLYNLAKNISNNTNWVGYTWKEDMISDAYLKCLYSINKFDINKSEKPFSFFTTIVFRFYIDYIKKFKKHKKVIEKLENDFKKKMLLTYNISYENLKGGENN